MIQQRETKENYRGRRSSASGTKREHKNKWYFPGSFSIARLARKHGAKSCGLDPAKQARQLLEAHMSAGQILEERMNRAEAAATAETLPAGGIRPGRRQVPEAPGADDGRFGFGALAARYQLESFSGRHCVARLVQGISFLGWTAPTWTSTRRHPSSGSPIWRGSRCH